MDAFTLIPENAARQFIDSMSVYESFRCASVEARKVQGGMYWKQQGDYCYLLQTMPDNRQRRIGARSAETEAVFEKFMRRKNDAELRLASLKVALRDSERLNKALRVGRTPTLVIALLQELDAAGLGEHFIVVGTHALYAYESAAGVRIVQSALATQDVDLLWDARRRVQFMATMTTLDTSVLSVLQRVDASFRRRDDQLCTAVNDKGFEVDFLRRMPQADDPHPFRLSADEDDLWPVQANRADVLTQAARFEHIVVSTTGRMALMRTIAPAVFVEFKNWMAKKSLDRPALKRRRDAHQAAIVQTLMDENLLIE